jgi:transcriptional regulator with XRE-family HTH domain
VRELRLQAGLTQEALALESGLSRNQIIEVEWGRSTVTVERLFDLAAALEADPAALLEEPDSWPTPAVHRGGRRRQQRTRPGPTGMPPA